MSSRRRRSALRLYISTTPHFLGENQTLLLMREGADGFMEATYAMADECDLYLYRGILYNMPAKADCPPPYYCVSRGRYIGVFTAEIWEDIGHDVQNFAGAEYVVVDSLESGEEMIQLLIEQGKVINLGPYHFHVE